MCAIDNFPCKYCNLEKEITFCFGTIKKILRNKSPLLWIYLISFKKYKTFMNMKVKSNKPYVVLITLGCYMNEVFRVAHSSRKVISGTDIIWLSKPLYIYRLNVVLCFEIIRQNIIIHFCYNQVFASFFILKINSSRICLF